MLKRFLLTLMIILSVAVALYGWALAFAPDMISNTGMQHHFANRPVPTYLHFVFGPLALAIGGFQFFAVVRSRTPKLHRYFGRLYVVSCLSSAVGGFLMALNTTEGPVAMAGFMGLAVGWVITTGMGYRKARARQFMQHREWMIRSFSLTFAAVTLRLYLPLFLGGFAMPFNEAYPIIAFLCWVPNLVMAEWIIRAGKRKVGQAPVMA